MNENFDLTGVIFGMGTLILGTIILVVVLFVAARFYQARAQSRDSDRLLGLLERYERASEITARHQESAATDLADVRARLESIERVLREVG
jgi:hypothetical protein